MRSWVYYIELLGHYEGGRQERTSAVYVVALPENEPLTPVDMECYASEYAPASLAISQGRAYAMGVDEPIENPQEHGLRGYREDLELYIFGEGVDFEKGLEEVYRVLYKHLNKEGLLAVEPVVDVGCPPRELMIKCLKRAVS
ncbi:MAG: hypothetical protein N3C57_06400 [Aquificaceae bacterium]|nr:hypothetical protein [Aquificaceae bacterium]MCS7196690.1 hypothetical protein [Aquificaceae bacterium]MCX8076647.1 hypothetical protein [Aquificaceae bacterium]MDW8033074.1 hypothetical protein [Aquificaceae bacterium]MDW8294546.1 hypothetical protein [Aquificaceae bacterium]